MQTIQTNYENNEILTHKIKERGLLFSAQDHSLKYIFFSTVQDNLSTFIVSCVGFICGRWPVFCMHNSLGNSLSQTRDETLEENPLIWSNC